MIKFFKLKNNLMIKIGPACRLQIGSFCFSGIQIRLKGLDLNLTYSLENI